MLAEKISGTHVGLWLLLPEHLRLGTWDLLTAWTGADNYNAIEPRLALQMVHEAALCINGVRERSTLRQKGFETLNGLPFVATDVVIHELLDKHSIAEAESLQVALGQIRYAKGHFPDKLILIDPHRIYTWSRRQMPPKKAKPSEKARKVLQTFFAINAESGQPMTFGIGSCSVTVTQATLKLVDRLEKIFPTEALLIGDSEHFIAEVLNSLLNHQYFSILVPMQQRKTINQQAPQMAYTPTWAGYAVAEGKYPQNEEIRLIVQRTGETKCSYKYKPFVTTSKLFAADLMSLIYPQRWNIEEFFNLEQALGWNRTSTLNLNIRYGKLTMALLAQAAIYELRKKLPGDINNWTAQSMAQRLFKGIDGDIRVKHDKIIVTMYNAPDVNNLKEHYENLPNKLEKQGIDPRVSWLYNFKVDFRFK